MAKKVLLVLGFQNKKFNARSKWQKLADRLEKEGFTIYISNYGCGEPMNQGLYVYAGSVASEIERLKPDIIIAHSMGCLVTRYAVEQLGFGYSGLRLILLEGPHRGLPDRGISFSRLAAKVFETLKRLPAWDVPSWTSWKDLQKGSIFISSLNWESDINGVSYYEVGGILAYLFPETFSLPGSICCTEKNIFPMVTHSGLKTKPKVVERIVGIIKTP